MRTIWDMKTSRLCIVNGEKTEDKRLDVIGTTLHFVPLSRWTDGLAERRRPPRSESWRLIRPDGEEDCRAEAGRRGQRRQDPGGQAHPGGGEVPGDFAELPGPGEKPPHPASSAVHGLVAAPGRGNPRLLRMRLERRHLDALVLIAVWPAGFQQDPAPNTINGTLMGADCTSPSKLRGFDQPAEPLILRSHSESDMGVSPQVIWPVGEVVTVKKEIEV